MSLPKAGCHEKTDKLAYISSLFPLAQVSIISWRRVNVIPSEVEGSLPEKLNNKFKEYKNYGKNHWN